MVQYFTKEGLQKLKDELHYLKTDKNKENWPFYRMYIEKQRSECVNCFGDGV